MKKIKLTTLVFSALLLGACHSPDQKWDSKSSADTLNNMKDSAADTSKSITEDLVMKVSKDDAKFAVAAANGGMAEVELGKLAQTNAASPEVKEFGSMMVKDHAAANEKMKGLAAAKGISLPKTIGADEQRLKDELTKKTGEDFDKAYVKAMIEDHREDIKEFTNAVQTLKDPELKAFAANTLPVLKMHLESIQKIDQSEKK